MRSYACLATILMFVSMSLLGCGSQPGSGVDMAEKKASLKSKSVGIVGIPANDDQPAPGVRVRKSKP